MTLAKQALGDRFPGFAPLPTAAADYDVVRRAIAHIRGNWRAQPEIDSHRPCRRRFRHRSASSVPPLVRADAESVPAGAHAQPRARSAALVGERAGHRLRGRPVRTRPAARSIRHARSDVAGRMEGRRRRADHFLWVPSLPVRHGAGDDHAARPGRPGAGRCRQGARGAQGHALALAEGALCRGLRGDRSNRAAHLRSGALAPRAAAARGADRNRFRSAGLGEAADDSDGQAHHLFRPRSAKPARRKPRARSAPRSARTRSASWCRATAWSARTATSPAITGASPASARCWAGKPGWRRRKPTPPDPASTSPSNRH